MAKMTSKEVKKVENKAKSDLPDLFSRDLTYSGRFRDALCVVASVADESMPCTSKMGFDIVKLSPAHQDHSRKSKYKVRNARLAIMVCGIVPFRRSGAPFPQNHVLS
jgi:hypothetical protein